MCQALWAVFIQPSVTGIIVIPTLQIRKIPLRKVREFEQVHRASKWQGQLQVQASAHHTTLILWDYNGDFSIFLLGVGPFMEIDNMV